MGNSAEEAKLHKLTNKSARKDKANHTKKAMAESAQDRAGKLLYNNIKSIKNGSDSKKLSRPKKNKSRNRWIEPRRPSQSTSGTSGGLKWRQHCNSTKQHQST